MKLHRSLLAGIVLSLAAAVSAQAASVNGSQGFADIGTPTVDTGNINTATSLTIGDLITTTSQQGGFAGLPTQAFGTVNFNLTSFTSLTFQNSTFGSFSSTSITKTPSTSGTVDLYVLGSFTPGTFFGGGSAQATSFTISFTQTPASTGSISDSSTLATPPATPPGVVPEPASVALASIGLVPVGLFRVLRKRMAK